MNLSELRWVLQHARKSIRDEIAFKRARLGDWRRFWATYKKYRTLAEAAERSQLLDRMFPCLGDDLPETPVDPVYFYQDSWAFGLIARCRPNLHVDVGSHHHFVGLLSKVVPVTMVDIRPLPLTLESLSFQPGSITRMPFPDLSVVSVSSLCVVEHIGLGRYGDPLDPNGTEKAIGELKRIVAPGGNLYISLPLDDENYTFFNAHRALKEEYVTRLFEPFEIVERRYILGSRFVVEPSAGFRVGCFHLRAPGSSQGKN
jgi:hypothetical protein